MPCRLVRSWLVLGLVLLIACQSVMSFAHNFGYGETSDHHHVVSDRLSVSFGDHWPHHAHLFDFSSPAGSLADVYHSHHIGHGHFVFLLFALIGLIGFSTIHRVRPAHVQSITSIYPQSLFRPPKNTKASFLR